MKRNKFIVDANNKIVFNFSEGLNRQIALPERQLKVLTELDFAWIQKKEHSNHAGWFMYGCQILYGNCEIETVKSLPEVEQMIKWINYN